MMSEETIPKIINEIIMDDSSVLDIGVKEKKEFDEALDKLIEKLRKDE